MLSSDSGVRPLQRHHQVVRRAAGAGQAVQVVRHEEVPAKRGEGAEESLPGPEEAGVPGDYDDENVSLAKIPIDCVAI